MGYTVNYAVDFGYLGGPWLNLNGTTLDTASQDAYFVDIRTRIATAMSDAGATSWEVSPVFKWTTTGQPAYGIVIKHLAASVPTGREWFIPMLGLTNATQYSSFSTVLQSLALGEQFFRKPDAPGGGFVPAPGGVGLHYHTGGLSTTYDLTGVVNDLDTPTTTPGAAMASFMPSFATVKHALGVFQFTGLNPATHAKWCMVFNHDVPFIGMYFDAISAGDAPGGVTIAGDIVAPRVPTDTYVDGALGMYVDVNTYDYQMPTSAFYASYLSAAGLQVTQNVLLAHSQFSVHNLPDHQLAHHVDLIALTRDSLLANQSGDPTTKGWFRRDVVAQQGWYLGNHCRMFDSRYGKSLKISNSVVVPWVTSPEPPPFSGWPINPQTVPR